MKNLGLVLLLLCACGRSPIGEKTATPVTTTPAQCPMAFEGGLCAQMIWKTAPQAQPAELEVRFWRLGEGSELGPYAKPPAVPETVLIATCPCKEEFPVALAEISPGVYRGEVKLNPHKPEYLHFLRLGRGPTRQRNLRLPD